MDLAPEDTNRAQQSVSKKGLAVLFALTSLFLLIIYHALSPSPLLPFIEVVDSPLDTPLKEPPREAYLTFLSSSDLDYFQSSRLLLFSLQHDPLTADPSRPFIVLTTPAVPQAFVNQLRTEGAIVIEKPFIDHPHTETTNPKGMDEYSKLWIFSMTEYDRIAFYEADHLVLKAVDSIWSEDSSNAENGIAALGSGGTEGHVEDSDHFSAGFFIARPSEEIMEELLVQSYRGTTHLEEDLLNKYFRRDGPRPWGSLNPVHEKTSPTYDDVVAGTYHTIRTTYWQAWVQDELAQVYYELLWRMEGYWLAKQEDETNRVLAPVA